MGAVRTTSAIAGYIGRKINGRRKSVQSKHYLRKTSRKTRQHVSTWKKKRAERKHIE